MFLEDPNLLFKEFPIFILNICIHVDNDQPYYIYFAWYSISYNFFQISYCYVLLKSNVVVEPFWHEPEKIENDFYGCFSGICEVKKTVKKTEKIIVIEERGNHSKTSKDSH